MNINLDNFNLNINFRIILTKIISNNVRKDLSIKISIKIINNNLKSIKIIKKALISYYSLY